ncbi:MAG: glycosyltransferase family 4 protein [Nitrospirota bacterium]|nr:glycosyltransferase family 4 protein [Nitrospirota bacterium]
MHEEHTHPAPPKEKTPPPAPRIVHFVLDHRPGGHHAFIRGLRSAPATPPSTMVTVGSGPDTDFGLTNLRHRWRLAFPLEVAVNVAQICLLRWRGRLGGAGTVFHVHGAANLAPLVAARLLRVPTIWQLHETLGVPRLLARLGQWALPGGPARIATVTQKVYAAFGIDTATTVMPPLDTAVWVRTTPLGKKTQPPVILSVGNLNPLKGQDVLIEAMGQVPGQWRLELVGEPLATQSAYVHRTRQMTARVTGDNPQGQIHWAGRQEGEQVRERLECCTLFVLPSRSEGCPIALLEAMSMGCVCIATDVGEVASMIRHGVSGWLVPPADPRALADAIRAALAQPQEDRTVMARAAREYVLEHHTPEHIARQLGALYSQTLADRMRA